MGKRIDEQSKKKICVGLVAHVDAGKTTLSEALLYTSGMIRSLGRVDHGNAFLDTDIQERSRGITIFSKQAELICEDMRIMLVDTPGHMDFSAEMERTLQVLDYAVLVISGKDGVQGHTTTLWKLLEKYDIPTFVFVNKMDLDGTDKGKMIGSLKERLDDRCMDFSDNKYDEEEAAVCDEILLKEYFEKGSIKQSSVAEAVRRRKIFPCYFGSALKIEGIESFIKGISAFTVEPSYGKKFAARVYKITRDEHGKRLTHMKITGGQLKVKEMISREKADQIRIYSGEKFRSVDETEAGDICAVTGPELTYAGQAIGEEGKDRDSFLEPAMIYDVEIPTEYDINRAFSAVKLLEEEDPQLHVVWNEQLRKIQLHLMGEVQLEVLKNIMHDRFGIDAVFGSGRITYKETIEHAVIGSGHFEPLRHYAEVHLLLEPGMPGTGLVFDSRCSEDVLDGNWQRLIMTHLAEREHKGVLIGAPITDMKITILAGKAHLKHTEGGDFRQATYRAIGQGLRKAEPVLLEPWYEFSMEIPSAMIGRAMADVQRMGGKFLPPDAKGEISVLTGTAPVSEMNDYSIEIASYTKGHGRLSCSLCGYRQCHNTREVIESIGYDSERDMNNTGDSVFCDHGTGVNVKWNESDEYMHISPVKMRENTQNREKHGDVSMSRTCMSAASSQDACNEDELKRILDKAYIAPKEKRVVPKRTIESEQYYRKTKPAEILPEYLLVDGYNIIFAWEELKALAKENLDGAREALIEILSNYQGYKKCNVIAVFDAYKVKGGVRRSETIGNIEVVYTKEAETADMYIERTTYEMKSKYVVRVATSDNLEQLIIMGNDAFKISAKEFKAEVEAVNREISEFIGKYNRKNEIEHKNRIKIP